MVFMIGPHSRCAEWGPIMPRISSGIYRRWPFCRSGVFQHWFVRLLQVLSSRNRRVRFQCFDLVRWLAWPTWLVRGLVLVTRWLGW